MRRRSGRISAARRLRDVLPVEDDRAGGRLVDAHHHARKRRFAAARLADQADGLAAARRRGRRRRRRARSCACRRSRRCGSGKCFTRPRTRRASRCRRALGATVGASGSACVDAHPRPAGSLRPRRRAAQASGGAGGARRLASPSSAPCGPARPSSSSGCSVHLAMRNGQRGAKRQPGGMVERIGRRALDRRQPARCRACGGRCAARR